MKGDLVYLATIPRVYAAPSYWQVPLTNNLIPNANVNSFNDFQECTSGLLDH